MILHFWFIRRGKKLGRKQTKTQKVIIFHESNFQRNKMGFKYFMKPIAKSMKESYIYSD